MAKLHTVRKFRRGPCWYLDYAADGRRARPSLGPITEQEAELKRQHLELTLNGRRVAAPHDAGGGGPTLAAFSVEYLEWHRIKYPHSYQRTESVFRLYLLPALGTLAIGAINRRVLERYMTTRCPHAEPATVAREMSVLQAILNKAVEYEILPRNRARGAKPPKSLNAKPAPFYTAEELSRLYAADPTHRSIWKLIANTGLRRSEAWNLKWEDVRDGALYVVSTPTERSKSGRYRLVPLSPGARDALAALANDSSYVLPRLAAAHTLTHLFMVARERAGLDHSLHALRHTFCSHLVMGGVDLSAVQELAGHASVVTTRALYVHLSPGHLQAAMAKLDI